jgi:Activator of Hsp90 ATPase homolog 1-like protein
MMILQNQSYTTGVEVLFSAAVVFTHLNAVSKWWPEDFQGLSAKLNDEFTLRTGDVHYSKQQIVEFVPDKKVVWLVIDSIRKPDNYVWTGAKMIFEITSNGDKTRLNLTYTGPVPENEIERLAQSCDMVIKDKFYGFIAGS